MLNKIVLSVFLVMLGVISYAQDYRFGFVFEPTSSWITNNDVEINNDGGNIGFKFGVIGERSLNDNFGITGGIRMGFGLGGTLKHQYGGKLLPESELSREVVGFRDDFPANTALEYKVGVLELPFSFKMISSQIGYLSYFAEFPILSMGFLTSAKAGINSSTVSSEEENVIKDVSTLFLNWGVGAGVEYEISSGTSLVGGIYYHSNLNDFTTNDATRLIPDDGDFISEAEDSRALMRMISLRVGVKF